MLQRYYCSASPFLACHIPLQGPDNPTLVLALISRPFYPGKGLFSTDRERWGENERWKNRRVRWRSAIGREEGVVLFFLPHQFNCSDSSTMSLYTLGFQLWSGKGGHKKRDRGMDRKKERGSAAVSFQTKWAQTSSSLAKKAQNWPDLNLVEANEQTDWIYNYKIPHFSIVTLMVCI